MGDRNLLVDMNNLGFITRFVLLPPSPNPRRLDTRATSVIFASMVKFIINNLERHNCTGLVIAADSKNVWRKDIYPEYKMSSTTNDDPYYPNVLEAVDKVFDLFDKNTAALSIKVPRCEADDIIGYWCLNSKTESIILSNDGDYKQLQSDLVSQFSPTQKKFVECENPGYELFLKCIRGDKNDNIPSAYPRVKTTTIKEAFEQPLSMANMFETVLKDGRKVGDNFKLNSSLIDLSKQPNDIKDRIHSFINNYENSKFKQISTIQYVSKILGRGKTLNELEKPVRALQHPPVINFGDSNE